jgi:hypothetical protein
MNERLNGGTLIAALGGVVLLVSLFLDWYEPDLSAWDSFELADVVLLAAAAAGIASVVRPVLESRAPDPARLRILLYIGIAALIVIVSSLIQPPPGARESSPEVGAWLGLAGALLIALGGLLAGSSVSVVITTRARDSVTPPSGTERVPAAASSEKPVPPPPGTPPAEPDSETSSIPTERG